MRSSSHSRSRRPLARLGRVASLVLLAAVGVDLAGDTRCDVPQFGLEGSAAFSAAIPPGTEEPCASFCVPDCFCCSRSLVARPAVVPPEPGPLTAVGLPRPPNRPDGVRPVAVRPPLPLA
jgi:hypothetical protein